ncbi:Trypanosomal VSG domain containing protein, putative [Trypanosoma equiperdum]|uniref:Trypanosomal VSG domain containing protein, putative n=1 Tax=Trypanosoma equiperdum TaxID=5694 RepID=A0A1G4I7E7_TRYEQ|nr:Trypanosomal VSG domain containing protein, putative [Trypanosoma equiperdum]
MLLLNNNGMRFTNLIAAVLALVAYRTALYTNATGPTKGENAKVFALLCDLVTTAEDAAARPVSLKPAEETTNAVALITLLLTAPETLDQLVQKTTRDALLAGTSKMPHKLCTVERVADCTAALQAVDKLGKAGVKRMVASFKQRTEVLDAINATTRALTSLLQNAAETLETGKQQKGTATGKSSNLRTRHPANFVSTGKGKFGPTNHMRPKHTNGRQGGWNELGSRPNLYLRF